MFKHYLQETTVNPPRNTIATSKNPEKTELTTLLNEADMVIFLDNVSPDAWVKVNPGQLCFYRTCYSSEMIEAMVSGIKLLSPVDRLGIENDLFALAMAGVSKTTDFLNILAGYGEELNYTVWSDLDSNLGHLSMLLQNTDSHNKFRQFVMKLYKPVAAKLGWDAQENEGIKYINEGVNGLGIVSFFN